jgi:PspA-Associated protein
MIVRISGEGQYRLPDDGLAELNKLENEVVRIVESGTQDGFAPALGALLSYVRDHGAPVAEDDLEGSDLILPPADLSFAEAGEEFTGEGLIPD